MKKTLVKEWTTYKGRWFTVIEQEHDLSGKKAIFENVRRTPGCRLIIRNEKGEFLVTKEYRYEHEEFDLRLPGGKVFDSLSDYEAALATGQPMLEAARKAATVEGAEEAGIAVEDVEFLGISKCGSMVTWDLYYFLVTKWHLQSDGQKLGLGEHITVNWLSPSEIREACLNGQLSEERSAIQLLRLLEKESG